MNGDEMTARTAQARTIRIGRSMAYPQKLHAVKKERELMGGCVAKWQCERGRGEVYGAVTVAGSWDDVNCIECRRVGGFE